VNSGFFYSLNARLKGARILRVLFEAFVMPIHFHLMVNAQKK